MFLFGLLTLSAWIKTTVHLAYKDSSLELKLYSIRAHDLRGLAATWAFNYAVPLAAILKAGTWSSHTSFTSFYLRDLSTIQVGLRCLGQLSVAQTIVFIVLPVSAV